MTQLQSQSVSRIAGDYVPPGDKSISHRVIMLGSLAEGVSEFPNFLNSEDCQSSISAFKEMGVSFDYGKSGSLSVRGVGLQGLKKPSCDLYLGNSGTTMRLLLGILAGQSFETTLTGDHSLSNRPMKRVTEPLKQMGAKITGREGANFAPLTVQGGPLKAIQFENQIASAQVKSAILLAGLYAHGETVIQETLPSRDHTERLLPLFGAPFEKSRAQLKISRPEKLKAISFRVPGDISSAAFFIAAALIVNNSDLFIRHVGLNPTRIGFLEAVKRMGGDLSIRVTETKGEPVGEIRVKSSRLKAISIDRNWIPNLIDELPILMILCALAEGTSIISGAEELRVKETDRIKSMSEGLKNIGGLVEEHPDGCVIEGVREFNGGTVDSFGDHRTAMSFLIAGLCSKKGTTVRDTDCIQTSYPGFQKDLTQLSEK